MRFHPLSQLPNAWTMVSGRFGVHLFEGEVTVEEMCVLEKNGDAWHADNPGRIVELVVIYPSRNTMTLAERAKMVQLIRRWEGVRVATSTVILAEGIVGALQRSILTGMMMLAPAPHPAKVHAGVLPALEFLAPHVASLGGPGTLPVLGPAVTELCRAFDARTTRR